MSDQTLRTTVGLNDQMTGALRAITRSMSSVIETVNDIAQANNAAFNGSAINGARASIRQVESTLRAVDRQNRQNTQSQRQHNEEIRRGSNAASGLLSKLKSMAGAYIGFQALKQGAGALVQQADAISGINSRINLMNDGVKSTVAIQKDLLDMAARTRTEYKDVADLVSKLGVNAAGAFGNTQEIMDFSEQISKHMRISGTDAGTAQGAMLQLQQAMSAGVLRGEELNSVMEGMPTVVQAIADEMGVSRGEIKALAEDGLITADVVKRAMLNSVDETNKKFESMPQTFSSMWNTFKTRATGAFMPVFGMLNKLANSSAFQKMMDGAIRAINVVAKAFLVVGAVAGWVARVISANWGWLKYIFIVLGTIIGVFLVAKLALAIKAFVVMGVQAIIAGAKAAAAFLIAHWPIALLILAIVAVIMICRHFGITFVQVAGYVVGAVYWMGAALKNFEIWVNQSAENGYAAMYNFAQNSRYEVLQGAVDMARAILEFVQRGQRGMEDFAYGGAQAIAGFVNSGIDSINKLIDKLNSLKFTIPDWVPEYGGKEFSMSINKISGRAVAVKNTTLSDTTQSLIDALPTVEKPKQYVPKDYGSYVSTSDAFAKGQQIVESWAKSISDKLSGLVQSGMDAYKNATDMSGIADMYGALGSPTGIGDDGSGSGGAGTDSKGDKALKDIALNTRDMADLLRRSDDEMTFIREVGRRRAVDNMNLDRINITIENRFENANNEQNWDGFVTKMTSGIESALNRKLSGVVKA